MQTVVRLLSFSNLLSESRRMICSDRRLPVDAFFRDCIVDVVTTSAASTLALSSPSLWHSLVMRLMLLEPSCCSLEDETAFPLPPPPPPSDAADSGGCFVTCFALTEGDESPEGSSGLWGVIISDGDTTSLLTLTPFSSSVTI